MTDQTFGVVAGTNAEDVAAIITDTNARVTIGEPAALPDTTDYLIAASVKALQAAAVSRRREPILPVGIACGIAAVAPEELPNAIRALEAEQVREHTHPILGVEVAETTARAFWDVTLITDGPAKISEFQVNCPRSGIRAQFRADGAVIATPAGSHGYAAAAGGPWVTPGTGLVVVPVAPFVIDPQHWVVQDRTVTISVCRDESPVAVEADSVEQAVINKDDEVRITHEGQFRTLATPTAEIPESGTMAQTHIPSF